MSKLLFIDTETTGIDCWNNGIIQISGIIDINGEVKEEFDFKVQPFPDDIIEDSALKVNKVTKEEIEEFESPKIIYQKLDKILRKYVNPFNKNDEKFILIGFNTQFDFNFLKIWVQKNNMDDDILQNMENLIKEYNTGIASKDFVEALFAFYQKNGNKYFSSFVRNYLDVRQIYITLLLKKEQSIPTSMKLQDICKELGNYKFHDSMDDVKATRDLYYKILNEIK